MFCGQEEELIELKKKEPPENKRRCTSCGKAVDKKSEGKLIHWPSESCGAKTVKIITGEEVEPFSFWAYTCRWCRGIETKRKSRRTS